MSHDPWHALGRLVDALALGTKAYHPPTYNYNFKRFDCTNDDRKFYIVIDPSDNYFALYKWTGVTTNSIHLGFSVLWSCAAFLEDTEECRGKNDLSIVRNIPMMIRVDGEGMVPYTTVRERFLQWDWDKTEYEVFEVSETEENDYRFIDRNGVSHDFGVQFSGVTRRKYFHVKIRCNVDGSMKTYHLPFGNFLDEGRFEFSTLDGGKLALKYFKIAYGETVTKPAIGETVQKPHWKEIMRQKDDQGRWLMEGGGTFPSREEASEFKKYFRINTDIQY